MKFTSLAAPSALVAFATSLAFGCAPKATAPEATAAPAAEPAPAPQTPAPAATAPAEPAPPDHTAALALPSLAKKFEAEFSIGAAIEPYQIDSMPDLLEHHFNRLTAENQMKLGPICPRPVCDYAQADRIAAFARDKGMALNGHAFVWHQMYPAWFFKDDAGGMAKKDVVAKRLRDHIFTMTQRYADVIDNWDVVNESISDTAGKTYRDAGEGSKFFEAFGGKEYIKLAFQYAAEAAKQHDPTLKLYYNDYNVWQPEKRKKILEMVRWLRKEGVRVDGVGLQGHWNLESPTPDEIRKTIDDLVKEKLEVKVSELDVNIYTKDDHGKKVWQPQMEFTQEIQDALTRRYVEIFKVFREKKDVLTQVTLWGVSDDHTWLNTWPLTRENHPLLLDRQHQPKPALKALLEL